MFTITDKTNIKIFKINSIDPSIEDQIKDFLKDNIGNTILKILQSESTGTEYYDFIITIFYEKK